MRFCLRSVVESKYSLDDVRILGGHLDGADAAAEISLGMAVLFELNAEGFLEIAHGSREHYGSARQLGAGFANLEAEFLGELPDFFEIGRIGAVGVFEVGARHLLEIGFFEGTP